MERLGPFELGPVVGAGGAGVVHRALHVPTGTPVAVKRLRAADDRVVERFHREVRLLAGLRHANVIRALDAGDDGGPWLAMALATRGSVAERPPGDWPTLRQVLDDTLAGLAHAHARGVRHGDVKPPNLLWFEGRVVVADFGIGASLFEDAGPVAGTLGYLAPERRRRGPLGPAADLWSVGVVAWELATGELPGGRFTPRFPVPEALADWIGVLLAPSPAGRFGSAAAARRVLAAAEGVRGAVAARVPACATVDLDEPTWRDATGEELLPSPERPSALPPLPDDPPDDPVSAGVGLGLVHLRPTPFVGREAERAALWAVLGEALRHRDPRLVHLRGPAGVGLSRLGRWLAESAAELGIGPGVVVDAGVRPADRIRAHLLQAEPRLGALAPARAGDDEGAAVALLREASATGAAVVVFDDAGDDAVSFALRLVESRPPVSAVCVLVGGAADLPGPVVTVGPLPPAALGLLARSVVGLDGRLARRLVDESHGSPGAVVDAISALARARALVAGPDGLALAPDAPEEPVAGPLPAGLEALATYGAWCPSPVLPRLAAAPDVADAIARGFLTAGPDGVRFGSSAARRALLRAAEAGGRAPALHRACAAVAEDPAAVSAHLAAAGDLPEAFDAGLEGLARRLRAGDGRVEDLLARQEALAAALRLTPAEERLAELVFLRAWHHARRGRLEAARAGFAEAADLAASGGWAATEARVCRTWSRLERGSLATSLALLDRAERAARRAGNAQLAANCQRLRGDLLLGRDPRAARAAYASIASEWSAFAAFGLAACALELGELDAVEPLLRGVRTDDAWESGAVENLRGELARRRGDLEAADRRYRTAEAIHRSIDSPIADYARLNRALVALSRGDRAAAVELAEPVADRASASPSAALRARAVLLWATVGTPEGSAWLRTLEATAGGDADADVDADTLHALGEAARLAGPAEAARVAAIRDRFTDRTRPAR